MIETLNPLAARGDAEVSGWLIVCFFGFVLINLALYVRFVEVLAPIALRRWAEDRGYLILFRKESWIIGRIKARAGNSQVVFRVVVAEPSGRERSGLAVVGNSWWPALLASRCSVEVRWDEPLSRCEKPRSKPDPDRVTLWDREIDR